MTFERGAVSPSAVAPATSWSEALRQRAGDAGPPDEVKTASRRSFIRLSFWGGLGVALLGATGTAIDFLYPRNVQGFGGPVPAGEAANYVRGGPPVLLREAQAWVVHLDPSEDRVGGSGGGAGLLALWQKCPHLGCAIPWRGGLEFLNDAGGWFQCPCHRSTYTKAGVRVFGPATRSMDTMLIEVDANGLVTIQTGEILPGGPDNPSRALDV